MSPFFVIILALGVAVVVAVPLIVILTRRLPGSGGDEKSKQLETDLAAAREAKAEADRRAAVAEEKANVIPGLQASLTAARDLAERLREEKAAEGRVHGVTKETLAAKAEALAQTEASKTELARRLDTAENTLDALRTEKESLAKAIAAKTQAVEQGALVEAELRNRLEGSQTAFTEALNSVTDLQTQMATLQETLAQEKKQADEKLADQKRLSDTFKVLAEEIMARHGEAFKAQNKEQIDVVLTPLREQIVAFQQGLQTAHTETAKDRATLAEQIRALTETSTKMSSETRNLTLALKGDSQTQGAWGEMVLSTILERSGLREGEEYFKQESHSGDDGERLRPDVFVNLPGEGEKRIVIDSKVSLTAFESYVGSTDEGQRAGHLERHAASFRNHVKALSSKEYQQLTPSGLDFVIMFVPIEGALAVALQADPDLSTYAVEHNVAIAAPTTLMIALRTIANVWRMERRNKNAELIAERAGKLYNKFVGFADDMQDLGGQLNRVRVSYDAAMGKLSTGGGNLVGQVQKLKDLGAKTAKNMPKDLLDTAGVEEPDVPEALSATEGVTPPEASETAPPESAA